jgi:hypothetical protein
MAKRTLGLGKAAKQRKKQKAETDTSNTPAEQQDKNETTPQPQAKSNEIQVELDDEVDPDNELNQLKGLWNTYVKSDKENELVLNGIIHESDLLLRNQTDDKKLPAEFHSIYALALAELAIFQNQDADEDDEDDEKRAAISSKVKDFFDAALERVDLGQEQYPDSIELNFTKARILLSRIPLEYISNFDLNSKKTESTPSISKLLDQVIKSYEEAEESVKLLKNYSLLDINVFETLKAFDDLLDIIRNFGKDEELKEGLDSDAEEDQFEDEEVSLSKSHPLYKVYSSEKYFKWLVKHSEDFGTFVSDEYKHLLNQNTEKLSDKEKLNLEYLKQVSLKVGQILLQAAEKPASIFTTIVYDSDVDDDTKIGGYSAKEAQKEATGYTRKAVEFFKQAEDEEDPQTWVDYAEAVISLGNLYDYESKDQEEAYSIAEKRLKRANKATNGKYKKVLDNLLQN